MTTPEPANSLKNDYSIYGDDDEAIRDRPWIFRTYAGHTSPRASNELYRSNLAKGQTGLSIAFDLATQCGYSSDHSLAKPEVGKVGVPINSLDDFHVLFNDIPLDQMNTSMTINATAMWLFSLYLGLARERNIDTKTLRGTTQNDIVKEYLARGTYVFPPAPSMRLIAEMYEYALENVPKWNAANICSYHLQEAGATPAQELAFALSNAVGILDLIRERGQFDQEQFARCVGRVSFFVNAGIRFVEEMCKMRAFTELWEEITEKRYGITDSRYQRFRYGVQVNSLGLTEAQPENNAWRILIEALGVTMSRKARCRALQLPTWNEALSLPRAWDQQWSLRLQQILAYETDLLEYPDLFDGSKVVEARVSALKTEARAEMATIESTGGISRAIESGYMKSALVRSMTDRVSRINSGEQIVVGLNKWTDGLPSPLLGGDDGGVFTLDTEAVKETMQALQHTRAKRDDSRVKTAIERLRNAAEAGDNLVEPSIECALARVTTGEWTDALRAVFGEYRAATGVDNQQVRLDSDALAVLRTKIDDYIATYNHRPRIVVAKPGLDGHSNGAEIIAVAAKNAGFEVIYSGIRLSPEEIVATAVQEAVDVIGVSLLSGSHIELTQSIMTGLQSAGAATDTKVVVGGIIPPADFAPLRKLGVAEIFTPSDFQLIDVVSRLVDLLPTSST